MQSIALLLAAFFTFNCWADLDLSLFEYTSYHRERVQNQIVSRWKYYTEYETLLPALNPTEEKPTFMPIRLNRFMKNSSGPVRKSPLLIVLPTVKGRQFLLEDSLAEEMVEEYGFHVIIMRPVTNPSNIETPMEQLPKNFRMESAALRITMDYVQSLPEVDQKNVFFWGSSFGGVKSVIAFNLDQRIKAGVFIVTSGNIPDLFINSQQKIVRAYRQRRMQVDSYSEASYQQKIHDLFEGIDLLDSCSRRKKEDVLMVISYNDDSVPSIGQLQLWKAYGHPKAYFTKMRHSLTVAKATQHMPKRSVLPWHATPLRPEWKDYFPPHWKWDREKFTRTRLIEWILQKVKQ